MKILNTFRPTFNPGPAGVGTLDFSALSGFALDKLYAVIDVTTNTPIFVAGAPGIGATANTTVTGTVLTLQTNTSSFSATDVLNIYYESSNLPTELNFLQERGGNMDQLIELQNNILIELRVMNELLIQGLNITDSIEALRQDIAAPANIGSTLP